LFEVSQFKNKSKSVTNQVEVQFTVNQEFVIFANPMISGLLTIIGNSIQVEVKFHTLSTTVA
jgi:hypothetical protein